MQLILRILSIFELLLLSYHCSGQNIKPDFLRDYQKISNDSLLIVFERINKNSLDSLYSEIKKSNTKTVFDFEYYNFRKGKPILVIETYLSEGIKDFKHSDDVSKYFELTSTPNHLLLINEKTNKLIAFVKHIKTTGDESVIIFTLDNKADRRLFQHLSKSIKKAIAYSPDFLILNNSLGLLTKDYFVIMIKNSQIYTFKKHRTKPIELNSFLRQNFKEDQVRNLSKWSIVFSDPDMVISGK